MKVLTSNHDSDNVRHEYPVTGDELQERGTRCKDKPGHDRETHEGADKLSSNDIDIPWKQRRSISTEGNEVGGYIHSKLAERESERAEKDGGFSFGRWVLLQNGTEEEIWVPVTIRPWSDEVAGAVE